MTAAWSSALRPLLPAPSGRRWLIGLLLSAGLLVAITSVFCWWYGQETTFAFPSLADKKDPDEIRRLGSLARELRKQHDRAPAEANPEVARLQREAAYQRVIRSRAAEQALSQLGGPDYPADPSWSRRTAYWILRKPLVDQSAWVDSYLTAYDAQVAPVEVFYNSIALCTSARTATESGIGFVFRRPRTAPGDTVAYDRFATRTDWELWISQSGKDGVTSEQWSGVLMQRPWLQNGSEVRPEWPSEDLRIQNEDACARMLHAGRVPQAFAVRRSRARASGTWEKPVLDLTFDLVCEDFPGWSFRDQLQLHGDVAVKEMRAKTRELGARSRDDLEKHVLGLQVWKELPVRFAKSPGGPAPLRAQFSIPDLPEIELGARLTEEGRLSFDALPDVSTRLKLAEGVAQAEKKLEAYRGRLELTRVQVFPSLNQLRFDFCAVEAGRPGSAAVEGIVWKVMADGKGRVELPAGLQTKGPALVPPVPAPQKAPETPTAIRSAVLKHLRSAYAALADAVQVLVTPGPKGGTLISLELTVADLEALQLGSVPADCAADVPALVDRLLSQDTVRPAAKRQWVGRNSRSRSLELKEWNRTKAIAVLAHELRLTDEIKLRWEDQVRRQGKSWKWRSEADVNAMLLAEAEQLLGAASSLNALRADLGALVVQIGVSPDYFGSGRWLRLSPPAVALRAGLKIPVINFESSVNNLVLDESGLRWGQAEYTFGYAGTISTPNVAVSDIKVCVRPKDLELEVSACVTPPMPPMPRTRLIAKAENPWLMLGYVEASLKGSWAGPVLSGSAKIVVARTPVADADLTLDFKEEEFRARIRAGNALPGLAKLPLRLLGEAKLSLRQRSLDTSIEANAHAQLRVSGNAYFALDKEYRPLLFTSGGIECRFGRVKLKGHVRDFHNDYAMRGTAVFDLPLLGKAEVVVEIDHQEGFRVSRRLEASSKWELVYKTGSLEDVEPNELNAALTGKGEDRNDPTRGDSGAERPEISEPPPAHVEKEETKPSGPSGVPSLPWRVASANLQIDFAEDERVLVSEVKSKARLLQVPFAELGVRDPRSCQYLCWQQGDGGADLLVLAPTGDRRVVHVRRVGKADALTVRDLTDEYRVLLPNLFATGPAQATTSDALVAHFELKMFPEHRAKPAGVRTEAGGYLFEYRQFSSAENKDLSHCQFFWVGNGESRRAIVFAPFIAPEQRTAAFFRDLATRRTDSAYVIVVAHDPARSRLSWLTQNNEGDWFLTPDAREPSKVPVHLTPDTNRPYQGSHTLALACFGLNGSARALKRAWIGPQAVCAEVADGWLLMRLAKGSPPTHLTRARFDYWETETRRFLPDSWRRAEGRKRLSAEDVACVAVADWQQLRIDKPDWQHANPLGLLQGLARAR